ncbi:MAG: autotransporter outer membrane beta-barrel domain-containing protein [Rhodobiaceae bacterium]|nr:autotransporter outer membrane beta-barrel domain-containing protein [Rhodobiaceae bacterium]MCC0051321.1 autotransporter outer membrane beta-barrel domain-containing protein [Rhodobiaceae bacterium]MCC0061553.1 autotransporter outer membrane beta-barrel domain-containing protein [Rhodobiaceae bacterium]
MATIHYAWRLCFSNSVAIGALLAFGVLTSADHASAQSFVVQSGQTVGQQVMNNPFDTGLVETGGTIIDSDNAVDMNDNDQTLINNGTITSTANDGVFARKRSRIVNNGTITGDDSGIDSSFDDVTIINNGTIIGVTRHGIEIDGDGITIVNSGAVTGANNGMEFSDVLLIDNSGTVTGTTRDGLSSSDIETFRNTGTIAGNDNGLSAIDFGSFFNAGTITGTNGGGVDGRDFMSFNNTGAITGMFIGVNAEDIGTFSNTGTITGQNGYGVFVDGAAPIFFNSGTITGFDPGVLVDDPSVSFVNTGVISSSNDDAVQIDTYQTFTNSGTLIAAAGNDAIRAAGIDTLTLLEGSNIQGGLSIGGTTTLVTGPGLSVDLTFNSGTQAIGSTSGNPFAQAGRNIVVADTTNMTLQDDLLADLTGGISGGVRNRLSALGGGMGESSSAYAASPYLTGYFGAGDDAGSGTSGGSDTRFWGSSFGTIRHQFDSDDASDATFGQAGLMFGADGWTSGDARFGIFAGAALAGIDSGAQETKTDSYFGGLYGQWAFGGGTLDAVLTAGFSGNDQDRDVANNLVPGGIETANADYDGWFVAPELTYTHPYEIAGRTFEAAATLRYAGLFLDGYTETGVTSPMTVADRAVHLATPRMQLGMPGVIEHETGAVTRTLAYAGIEMRAQFGGDTVTGSILAQAVTFTPGGDDVTGGIFAGGRFEQVWNEALALFGGFEVMLDTAGLQASTQGGVRVRF